MSNPSNANSIFLNDQSERPLSVYDNLSPVTMPPSNTNCQKKDDEKSSSRDLPFCNISFKFDNTENDISRDNNNKLGVDFTKATPHTNDNNYQAIIGGENGQKFHAQDSIGTNGISSRNQNASQYSDVTESGEAQQLQQQQQQQQQQQSTVIEKPVISDAKSKFFGLKDGKKSMDSSESTQLIEDSSDRENNFEVISTEPKYENIPSNSAIHRGNVLEDSEPLPDTNNYSGLVTSTADSFVLDSSPNEETEPNSNRSTRCYHQDSDIDVSHHPSQVVYMSTTVPQNIKGANIAGRHTPTRNSLRHSRMLVINNKNYKGAKDPNALNLRHPKLSKLLLIFQIIFGVLLTFIGVWILLWAPNTRIQDNPYWSGLALTLAGIVGLIVIRFRRSKRQKLRENCFTFLKLDSYVMTISAAILCFAALICATIHLNNLLAETTKCISTDILVANAACICKFGVTNSNTTTKFDDITDDHFNAKDNEFQYRDLSCGEVSGAWKYILMVSVILNSLGFLATSLYLTLLFWKKDSKADYATVRSDPF